MPPSGTGELQQPQFAGESLEFEAGCGDRSDQGSPPRRWTADQVENGFYGPGSTPRSSR